MLKVLNCFLTLFNLHNPNILRNFASQSDKESEGNQATTQAPITLKQKAKMKANLKKNCIVEYINNLEDSDKVALWNEYQNDICGDSQIYDFDEYTLKDLLMGKDPMEIVRMTFFGKITSWLDQYIWINDYGNLESCYSLEYTPFDADDMAEWFDENKKSEVDESTMLEILVDEAKNIFGEDADISETKCEEYEMSDEGIAIADLMWEDDWEDYARKVIEFTEDSEEEEDTED